MAQGPVPCFLRPDPSRPEDARDHAEPLDTLQTPCLLLDEARLRANAERMRTHLTASACACAPTSRPRSPARSAASP